MRPHRLSLTAFGSFPGTETVDFDALTEAGIFLVHGPTGAGKTTVLDALCFALYGQVPGQRNSARSLRCDHAAPGVGPSVTLEVTIRGRLLRIQRSPSWQRPKLRGTGFTEEKAKVIVSEWRDSAWRGLTTRHDEAGDLVGGLLGMNAAQFCQVAMLPQGDFAKFLRADGDERAKLLERLFSVKVFTQAESWLAEHRKLAWRAAQELRQQVDLAVSRVEEAAGPTLTTPSALLTAAAAGGPTDGATAAFKTGAAPEPEIASGPGVTPEPAVTSRAGAVSEGGGVGGVTADGDPLGWAGALLAAARAVVVRSEGEHESGAQAVRAARSRFDRAAALAERQRRYADALAVRRGLDERADERADLQAVLDDAARADRVLPLVTVARQRAEAATKADVLAADAVARARPFLTPLPVDEPSHSTGGEPASTPQRSETHPIERTAWPLSGSASEVSFGAAGWAGAGEEVVARLAVLERGRQDEIARLSELLAEEARLSVLRRDLARVEAELAELVTADEDVAARLAVLPELVEEAERRLAEARADAARVPAVAAVRDAAAHLIDVDRELSTLEGELSTLAERAAEVAAAEADLPGRIAEAAAALSDVRAEAAAVPAAAAHLDAARAVLDAAHRRAALAAELDSAVAAHLVCVDEAQALRERWLDLRQARIDGMAAELARELSEGAPCAVCGSEHHPHPAAPAPSAPSADDEREAEAAYEAALAGREVAERTLASLESRLVAAAEAAAGLDVDAAEAQVRQSEQELARLQAVADREPALAAELERIEAERERVRERAREIAEALAGHRAHRAGSRSERARLQAGLAQQTAALGLLNGTPTDAARPPSGGHLPGQKTVRGAIGTDRDAFGADGGAFDAAVTPPDGSAVLEVAERELRRLRQSAARESALAGEVAKLHRERVEREEHGRRVVARLAACRTRQEELSGDAARLGARLDAARGHDDTLTARLSRLGDEAELLREAREAAQTARTARDELDKATLAAEEAAVEAGFADVREAEAAYRTPSERDGRTELLRRLDDQYAAAEGVLSDPELVAAAAEPTPDLPALEAERDALEEAFTRLTSARDRAVAVARRLEELHAELAGHIESWRPAAERHRLAERMAALASGTSGDNQWSMSLSSYVLGERLRQVVDAANERLDHMSGGRYLLRHDLRKSAGSRGRAGGGLGLRVADGWTGVDRDPATLSGGESFITSLALALGLADVVTAEAGGAELGTLFVDEGFGTLDEDTLDGVLDILDGLRDGGRAVGIVSHVAELRARIPAQLKVTKTRTGSTLSAIGLT
ncbi:exonuclease SbcC [Nonomuraea maritima]|uniref:Nuclease SbcCD subunit C n=1 Tax=Nonomuraea maritima TaxID=683260 RepID=A0A1G9SFY0_9ACTN|nr:AAA family ATPase [Nonomuraea maritima]SDM34349.1 exonuclease SbcC [Nonomuraea maritima]